MKKKTKFIFICLNLKRCFTVDLITSLISPSQKHHESLLEIKKARLIEKRNFEKKALVWFKNILSPLHLCKNKHIITNLFKRLF